MNSIDIPMKYLSPNNDCQNMICLSSSYFHVRWSVRLHWSEHFGVVRILSETGSKAKRYISQAFIESHFATGNPLWNQKPLEKKGCHLHLFSCAPQTLISPRSPFSPRWGSNKKNGSRKSPESRRRNIRKISRAKIRAHVCWPAGWFNRVHLVAFLWDRKVWGKKGSWPSEGFFHAEIVRRTLGASDSDVQIWPSDISNVFCLGGIERRKKEHSSKLTQQWKVDPLKMYFLLGY